MKRLMMMVATLLLVGLSASSALAATAGAGGMAMSLPGGMPSVGAGLSGLADGGALESLSAFVSGKVTVYATLGLLGVVGLVWVKPELVTIIGQVAGVVSVLVIVGFAVSNVGGAWALGALVR